VSRPEDGPAPLYRPDSPEGRFLAGDPEAVAWVTRWVSQILTRARFRILHKEWVDHHQEIMRQVVHSLRAGNFDAKLEFRAYVQSIAWYTARDAVDRRMRELRRTHDDMPVPEVPERPDDVLATRTLARKALQDLTEECRGLLRLYFFDDRSHREIAYQLNIAVGTVKSRLSRCLGRARELLTGNRKRPGPN